MSRFFAPISLPLGLLLAFAGCAGVESESQPPWPGITESVQSIGPEEDKTDGDEVLAEVVVVTPGPETLQAAQIATIDEEAIPEPNAPIPSEAASEPEAVETVLLEAVGPAEPNLAGAGKTEAQQANEQAPLMPEEGTTVEVPAEPTPADKNAPEPLASFYQGYAEILLEYVLEDGRVDYGNLRRKRLRLKHLLSKPDELDPSVYQEWPDKEKLAFWINTYNLKMLEVIVRNYPIQSSWWLRLTWPPSDIRHIDGIWSDYRFIVMDEEFTLGEVERRLFRKTFGDPRIYLALTYAARSGPSLRHTPYRGLELDRQLDEQIKAFLSSDQGFRIDRDKGMVYLSALFKPSWRGKEFVGHYGTQKKFKDHTAETRAVLNFLTKYLSEENVYFLEVENYTLAYMNFDWRLSDRGRGY